VIWTTAVKLPPSICEGVGKRERGKGGLRTLSVKKVEFLVVMEGKESLCLI
jgi:hypothetical protein